MSNGVVNPLFDFGADLCLEGVCFFVDDGAADDFVGFLTVECSASDSFGAVCGLESIDNRLGQ